MIRATTESASGGSADDSGEALAPPSLAVVRAAMEKARPDVLACLPADVSQVAVRLTFLVTGKVGAIDPPAGLDDTASACVRARLRKVEIPAFGGAPVPINFVYKR
jgi:hypothetical protein